MVCWFFTVSIGRLVLEVRSFRRVYQAHSSTQPPMPRPSHKLPLWKVNKILIRWLMMFFFLFLRRKKKMLQSYHQSDFCYFSGNGLCSCCVSDPMGLSFLPPYGCQGNRTASVAALRMKAREHSEAVLQSANLLSAAAAGPGAGVGVLSGVGVSAAGVVRPAAAPAIENPSPAVRGGDSSSPNAGTKVPVLGGSPDKHPHCPKEPLEKKWGAGHQCGCTDNLCGRACYSFLLYSDEQLSTTTADSRNSLGHNEITLYGC